MALTFYLPIPSFCRENKHELQCNYFLKFQIDVFCWRNFGIMKSGIFLPIGHVYKSEVDLGSGPRCSPWGAIWVDDAGWELD